ncbi:putative PTS IIA-like nitrogen-regulatory protein PtsN [Methylorubrum populi]|uniref:Putative PTS IIA-like nitrogen-regulatory protein PtsN n=1 Tax=Methylorubrum populi TaxID=223967 RepID=A0A160PI64_9HYPH|nr:PTS sugar transporter subunit IIA [Methylorubrum populi]BAU92614.1 putative PTS IIA-like nitrogen-regulatory protein PtsN [Methylorubrum populi]
MTSSPVGPVPDEAMSVDGLLAPGQVIHGLRVSGKAALLDDLAGRAARMLALDAGAIRAALVRREGLGSTGIGGGVALPHARLDAVRQPYGLLARLRDPLDFDAIDERPVDLVFLLLLPAGSGGETLNALARVARRLRDPETAAALRGARDAAGLLALVSGRTLDRA